MLFLMEKDEKQYGRSSLSNRGKNFSESRRFFNNMEKRQENSGFSKKNIEKKDGIN